MNRTQFAVAFTCLALVALFTWGRKLFPDAPVDGSYFTGMLVRGVKSGCGLAKVLNMDRKSCTLPASFCSDHEELLNKRVRISARSLTCTDTREMRCSEGGDFYDAGFAPTECYGDPQLQKVFDDPS